MSRPCTHQTIFMPFAPWAWSTSAPTEFCYSVFQIYGYVSRPCIQQTIFVPFAPWAWSTSAPTEFCYSVFQIYGYVSRFCTPSNDIRALRSLGLEYECTNRILLFSFSDIWLCELILHPIKRYSCPSLLGLGVRVHQQNFVIQFFRYMAM